MLPGSKIYDWDGEWRDLQMFCRCLAEAGVGTVLSVVGLSCLHRVTSCCTSCKAESPPWVWLLSLGYLIAKRLHLLLVCPVLVPEERGRAGFSQRCLGARSQLKDAGQRKAGHCTALSSLLPSSVSYVCVKFHFCSICSLPKTLHFQIWGFFL